MIQTGIVPQVCSLNQRAVGKYFSEVVRNIFLAFVSCSDVSIVPPALVPVFRGGHPDEEELLTVARLVAHHNGGQLLGSVDTSVAQHPGIESGV